MIAAVAMTPTATRAPAQHWTQGLASNPKQLAFKQKLRSGDEQF